MFELPVHFDKNEWFVTVSGVALGIGFWLVPSYFPRKLTLSVYLYFAALALLTDVLIGVDYPVNFYDIMDTPKLELFDVVIYLIHYPIYGYFFCYILCRWTRRLFLRIAYIPAWSGATAGMEWFASRVKVYTYLHGWNTGYSVLLYLAVYSITAILVTLAIPRFASSAGAG